MLRKCGINVEIDANYSCVEGVTSNSSGGDAAEIGLFGNAELKHFL
jgi:hypothetical protein